MGLDRTYHSYQFLFSFTFYLFVEIAYTLSYTIYNRITRNTVNEIY